MWPLKVRVGANSPSLCPTMPSVMNTGTCLRPSCTAMVCPSMSGMIVERRDQVLITLLLPLSFCASTFLSRWSSTNGPFFKLRGTVTSPLRASPHRLLAPLLGAARLRCSLAPEPHRFLFVRRRRTISLSLALWWRVRPSGRPFGVTGGRPPDVLPPPPPCGGATRVIAPPPTGGRLALQRNPPALPPFV